MKISESPKEQRKWQVQMPLGITFRDFHQVIKAIKEAEMEICP